MKAIEKKREKSVKSGNLVIIIDGVDKYLDINNKEDSPDWLSNELPPSVRMIYTCSKNSRAFEHISAKVDIVIEIQSLTSPNRKLLFETLHKEFSIVQGLDEIQQKLDVMPQGGNPLFVKLLLLFLHSTVQGVRRYKPPKLDEVQTVLALTLHFIDFYAGHEFKTDIIGKFFQLIALTRSGISEDELCRLSNCKRRTVISMLELFAPFLHNSGGFYILKHDIFRLAIMQKFPIEHETLHLEMIRILDDHKLTIRKIDELLFHLCESKNWMRLKDLLTQLEVFIIMYSAPYKMELYMYWVKLEQQHFDPVQEYNRALEEFVAQYSPSSKDLFMLLIQFCRFFKDLAEVESNYTSKYRHPHFRGYYELKDINLLEEIETMPGMYFANPQSGAKEDEQFPPESQVTLDQLREKMLLEKFEGSAKTPEFYYYKRWLWIQFPWCAIDVSSNFSNSMKNFTYTSDMTSAKDELNIFLSVIKLVSSKRNSSTAEISRISSIAFSNGSLTRTPTQNNKNPRGLCVLPEIKTQSILIPHIEDEIRIRPKMNLSTSLNFTNPAEREYSIDIMFKELVPGNILQKIGTQVINYSNHELLVQKKETYELQKSYNKLREDFRQKSLKLEALRSQIANSLDKMKEQEEVKNKAVNVETQIEKIFDKCYRAEEEGKRLQKIVTCCIKNPTRNDEWERGLEKALENMKLLIKMELESIKTYEKETQEFEEQSKTFQNLKFQRNQVQNTTLARVTDHLQVKSKIKIKKINRKKRRLEIFSQLLRPKVTNEDKAMVQKYENAMQQIHSVKKIAKIKMKGYENMVEKLSVFRKFDDIYSLYEIIATFDKYNQLQEEIKVKRKNIEYISREKEALELQLEYFKNKKFKDFNKPTKFTNFEEVNFLQYVAEKKLEEYAKGIDGQEYTLMKARSLIDRCWSVLKVPEKLMNENELIKMNFNKIISRLGKYEKNARPDLFLTAEEDYLPMVDKKSRALSYDYENFTQKSTIAEIMSHNKNDPGAFL